jgi:integrase
LQIRLAQFDSGSRLQKITTQKACNMQAFLLPRADSVEIFGPLLKIRCNGGSPADRVGRLSRLRPGHIPLIALFGGHAGQGAGTRQASSASRDTRPAAERVLRDVWCWARGARSWTVATGMRLCEVYRLRVDQVDLKRSPRRYPVRWGACAAAMRATRCCQSARSARW